MERQASTIHINKFVDLPDGSTVQIVASGPLLTFLVIQKQQNGSRILYVLFSLLDKLLIDILNDALSTYGRVVLIITMLTTLM